MKFGIIRYFSVVIMLMATAAVLASDDVNMAVDSVQAASVEKPKGNIFKRLINYFDDANKEKTDKKFDISFIGGPSYSKERGVGLGVLGAAQYRLKGAEHLSQPSQMALFANVGTVGFYCVGVQGNNFFADDSHRLNYEVKFYSFPSKFWGMGYDMGIVSENESKMKYLNTSIEAEWLWRISKQFYAGPAVKWNYAKINKIDNESLLDGQKFNVNNLGVGVRISYDSRDVVTSAHKGVYVLASQMFNPRFLGNGDYHYISTQIDARFYQEVWKDGVIAVQAVGEFNYGNPSWATLTQFGGDRMGRGYYEGRYRDKHMLGGQLELRQRVWKRSGIVVWGGAGTVFHGGDKKHWLPTYGVGYRWEFKKRMNVRFDFGFGKAKETSLCFSINEAF